MDQGPLVGIIMGSRSDWDTMQSAAEVLRDFDVPHECQVVSAHRTPDAMFDYAKQAAGRGLQVIICGAGGAAHLPGMVASQTNLPVLLGVPVQSKSLNGLDSLLSIVQMPGGVPVGTLAIGTAGAKKRWLMVRCGFWRCTMRGCATRSLPSANDRRKVYWPMQSSSPLQSSSMVKTRRSEDAQSRGDLNRAARSASSAVGNWGVCSAWPRDTWVIDRMSTVPSRRDRPVKLPINSHKVHGRTSKRCSSGWNKLMR